MKNSYKLLIGVLLLVSLVGCGAQTNENLVTEDELADVFEMQENTEEILDVEVDEMDLKSEERQKELKASLGEGDFERLRSGHKELRSMTVVVDQPDLTKLPAREEYAKWAYDFDDEDNKYNRSTDGEEYAYYDVNAEGSNCVGLVGGYTEGFGDVLSTLISRDEAREQIGEKYLDVYSPNYLRALEKMTVDAMEAYLEKDVTFYAHNVCNLGDDVDFVAGNTGKDSFLIYRNGNELTVYEDLQTLNHTATGGEVYPCEINDAGTDYEFSCFWKLDNEHMGSIAHKYTIDKKTAELGISKLISEF